MSAGKDNLVSQYALGKRLNIMSCHGSQLILGEVHVDVGISLAGEDGFLDKGIAAVAHDDGQFGEVTGYFVNIPGVSVLNERTLNCRRRSCGNEDRDIQLATLGVDGIVAGLGRLDVRKIGVGGNAAHAVFLNNLFHFADTVHALVGVNAPEAIEKVRIGLAEFQDAAVVGRRAIGCLAVTSCNDAAAYTTLFQIIHNFRQGLGNTLVKAAGLAGSLEHGRIGYAVKDFLGIGTETKIKDLHWFILLL